MSAGLLWFWGGRSRTYDLLKEGGVRLLGRICCSAAGRGVLRAETVRGLTLWTVELPEDGSLRRFRRAGARLAGMGVRRVVGPEGFSHWQMLERWGLQRVDPAPLRSALAPAWVLWKLGRAGKEPRQATVLLRGGGESPAMVRTAFALCPEVRTLAVEVPGNPMLPERLRRQFGMPVLPPEEGGADVIIDFAPEALLPGTELFFIGEEGEKACRDTALLCALWERGRLPLEEIRFEEKGAVFR